MFVVALLLIGRYYPGSGADVLDWKPTRSPEVEIQNELDDVAQMLEAQNEIRRRRGLPDRTEDDVTADTERHRRELDERVARWRAESDVARVLIVGCGCRGQALARGAASRTGHAVRGTTRDPARSAEIAAAGAEPYVGDPDRIGTLMDALAGVTILCWLMGSASGENARRCTTGGCGCCARSSSTRRCAASSTRRPAAWGRQALARGLEVARDAHERWMIPLEVLMVSPEEHDAWRERGPRPWPVARLLA